MFYYYISGVGLGYGIRTPEVIQDRVVLPHYGYYCFVYIRVALVKTLDLNWIEKNEPCHGKACLSDMSQFIRFSYLSDMCKITLNTHAQ